MDDGLSRLNRHRPRGRSAPQKFTDALRNFDCMRFKCEVTGIEKADDCAGNFPLECLRSRGQKKRIVLAPHREERRLVGSKVLLKGRVKRDVAFIIPEQIELNVIRASAGHEW